MKKVSVIALVIGAIFLTPMTAFANTLVATSPLSGATLQSAPSAVTITTELPLMDTGNEVSVTDPTGVRVDDGALTIDGINAVIGLKQLVKTGIYSVNYSLLAENDVPLVGTFTFNFAEPTVIATVAPEPSKIPTPSGNNLGTTIFVLGLLAAAVVVTIALSLYARKLYRDR
ncbi:Copper-binding protein CopC [Candidatus Planktophila sulfonica]|uniref:Copper-binding protein CopC n=1 Tax=Candidatus Planktophila sulfonica TaxID=1884904 RepID=A0A249KF85_9ACTN|nr:copper resistance protein CopC [Candidatus Planktophila sulfonica]ASY15437.1 Copper-binding protein CopC [Candidatus Planktophila sulfonica]